MLFPDFPHQRLTLGLLSAALLSACVSAPLPPPPDGWDSDRWAAPPQATSPEPAPQPLFKQTPPLAPVPKDFYRIVAGDTLHRIATAHGRKSSELAAWNNLANPDSISVGQLVRIAPPAGKEKPLPTPKLKTAPAAPLEMEAPQESLPPPAALSPPPKAVAGHALQWPTAGKVTRDFDGRASKGIDIQGGSGDAVYAAHDGKVAYSGQLRGYGKIVLIKTGGGRMTAYAHLGEATAKDGQQVKQGDRIGHFKRVATGTSSLHFELRQDGQPVDPMKSLPPR